MSIQKGSFMKIFSGAGIIMVKRLNKNIKYLGLIGPHQLQAKHSGMYDIPKGRLDPGESFYNCAIRECKEEADYDLADYNILSGPWLSNNGHLHLWLAETWIDPVLNINPAINKPEHCGYDWLDYEEIVNNCYSYLRDGLEWSRSSLEKLGKF